VAQTIEQEALKQLLKRMKNSVDKDTYYDNRQYNGENQLIGIKSFHEKSRLIFSVQPKCGMKYTYGKLCILFFDDTGNSDFRCADHHNVYVFSGQCVKHH
jgi:hypothetical protein